MDIKNELLRFVDGAMDRIDGRQRGKGGWPDRYIIVWNIFEITSLSDNDADSYGIISKFPGSLSSMR
jgi:hypothetical protein